MDSADLIIVIILAVTIIVVLYFVYKTTIFYKKIEKSFSKLGYIIREDSKNLFKDSSGELNRQKTTILEDNKQSIRQALLEAIAEQKSQSAEIVAKAYQQADQIISNARADADNITKQAEERAEKLHNKAIEKSSYLVESVIVEYVARNCQDGDHEKIVQSIINKTEIHDV